MLTLEDREEISRGIAEGLENRQIAVRIGRCASVVSREIGRHGGRAEYRASRAERAATTDRKRSKARKLDADPYLRLVVVELLKQGWSPQQIAGRLPIDHPGEEAVRVSHEAVYRWIYALPKGELARQGLALRSGRTRRKPAHGRTPKAPRIAGMRWIEERPAGHAAITLKADLPVYFAHPHSPWERGTNANTNRWLREYFPKGTAITGDPDYLHAVADELNNRPRAILGYLKPKEVFAELLTSGIATTG